MQSGHTLAYPHGRPKAGGSYALFGTTTAPAFQLEGFEAAECASLLERYPGAREQIAALTRTAVGRRRFR